MVSLGGWFIVSWSWFEQPDRSMRLGTADSIFRGNEPSRRSSPCPSCFEYAYSRGFCGEPRSHLRCSKLLAGWEDGFDVQLFELFLGYAGGGVHHLVSGGLGLGKAITSRILGSSLSSM